MASPAFHWEMACTAVLNEAIHKSGCGYTKFLHDTGFSRDTPENKKIAACWLFAFVNKKIAACWLFAFVATHTLAAPDLLFALIGPSVNFTQFFSV
jgi:hypothetical protein